jgi:ABC-type transport system substrate-binding protein
MEQARLVRWALSYALDRDGMIQKLWGGLGKPIPVEYVGPDFQAWEPNRIVVRQKLDQYLESYGWKDDPTYGQKSPYDDFGWPWTPKYDPKKAEQILDKAGYTRGANGVRFEITINAYLAGELGGLAFKASDAMAAMWDAIGVRATILKEDYGAVISPRMRKREQFLPVPKNCDVEETTYPADWPLPVSDTSITRPGWGCGFEAPFLAKMIFKIKEEPNKAKRIEMHKQVLDWMIYWQLYTGIVELPAEGFMVNPKKDGDWKSRQKSFGGADRWGIATVE